MGMSSRKRKRELAAQRQIEHQRVLIERAQERVDKNKPSLTVTLPDDGKTDIAEVVRSIDFHFADDMKGGACWLRALSGYLMFISLPFAPCGLARGR
jgi:hypothetical protein